MIYQEFSELELITGSSLLPQVNTVATVSGRIAKIP
jgi:hypothetical protein